MLYLTGSYPVIASGRAVGRVNLTQDGLKLVFDCICDDKRPDVLRLAAVCGGKYIPLGVMMPYNGVLRLKKSFTQNALQSIGYHDTAAFHLIKPGDVYSEPENALPVPVIEPAEAEPVPVLSSEEPDAAVPAPAILLAEQADVLSAQVTEAITYNDFPDPEDYDFDYNDDSEPDAGVWMTVSNPGFLFNDQSIREICEGLSNTLVMEQDGYVLLAVPILPTEPFPMMSVFCFGSSGEIDGQEYIIFKIRNGNLVL